VTVVHAVLLQPTRKPLHADLPRLPPGITRDNKNTYFRVTKICIFVGKKYSLSLNEIPAFCLQNTKKKAATL
jgi:hypothetical protein